MMMANDQDHASKAANSKQMEDKLRSMTMRVHQTEEMLTQLKAKIESGQIGNPEAASVP